MYTFGELRLGPHTETRHNTTTPQHHNKTKLHTMSKHDEPSAVTTTRTTTRGDECDGAHLEQLHKAWVTTLGEPTHVEYSKTDRQIQAQKAPGGHPMYICNGAGTPNEFAAGIETYTLRPVEEIGLCRGETIIAWGRVKNETHWTAYRFVLSNGFFKVGFVVRRMELSAKEVLALQARGLFTSKDVHRDGCPDVLGASIHPNAQRVLKRVIIEL